MYVLYKIGEYMHYALCTRAPEFHRIIYLKSWLDSLTVMDVTELDIKRHCYNFLD